MITVQDLRDRGCSVMVRHLKRRNQVRGGSTFVEITFPDGKVVSGSARCSEKDNYCRRTGREYAISRALLQGYGV